MRRHLLGALLILLPTIAEAWQVDLRLPGDEFPTAVAVAPGGDVLFATVSDGRIGVSRLQRRDALFAWDHEVGEGRGAVTRIVNAGDDVVVEGHRSAIGGHFVQRLSGAGGTTVWEDQADDEAYGTTAVDASGDVFIARATFEELVLRKLDGGSGRELWRYVMPRTLLVATSAPLAVDAEGNVVVGGHDLVKLDGYSGAVLWRVDFAPASSIPEVVGVSVDPSGDVFVEAGGEDPLDTVADVLRLDGRSGAIIWRQSSGYPGLLGTDAAGRVIVGDGIPSGRGPFGPHAHFRVTVSRLDPTTGTRDVTWRLGSLQRPDLIGVQVGPGGDLFAAVTIGTLPSDARLFRLRSTGGGTAWTRSLGRLHGTQPATSISPLIAVGADDVLVAAWVRFRRRTGFDTRIVTLSARTGRVIPGPHR